MADEPLDKKIDDMTARYASAQAKYKSAQDTLRQKHEAFNAVASELEAIGVPTKTHKMEKSLEEHVDKNVTKQLPIDKVYNVSIDTFFQHYAIATDYRKGCVFFNIFSSVSFGQRGEPDWRTPKYINVRKEVDIVLEARYHVVGEVHWVTGVGLVKGKDNNPKGE
ncbi:TPA: hypothetical protein HA251_01990 [Candidatus Woesearchaeota archaeon]|nr:hypothetical protein [Candidatus Woesearchaeota archaeon]